jgi:hypothetical protein
MRFLSARPSSKFNLALTFCWGLMALVAAAPSAWAFDSSPTVTYLPAQKLVEGDEPVASSYVLSITSPPNVPAGTTLSITPVVSVLSAPLGADLVQILGFVSLSPATLSFTGPGQTQTVTVSSNVPLGSVAGSYAYKIATPGWPTGTLDGFATINMAITIAQVLAPPSVALTSPTDGSVYTLALPGPALSIPLQFQATAPLTSPILTAGATISGAPVTVTTTGIGTGNVTGSGTMSVSAPGIYTVQAYANNLSGTSSSTVEITVKVSAPPPTVVISSPAANTTYTYTTGGPALSVPFAATATSVYGGVNTLTATLNGTPVSVTTGGLGTLNATGSGSLQITAGGQYVLAVTATDPNGTTTTSRTFTVTAVSANPPSITISNPPANATYTYTTGGSALHVPFAFTATSPSGSISALTATLNGKSVSVTSTGIGTLTATGSGSLEITAGGQYVLAVTATNPAGTVTASRTFTVTVVNPVPAPSVTISDPNNGTVYTHVAGNPALCIPFDFTAMAKGSGNTISAVSASLNGSAVTVTSSGLGRTTATGSGSLQVSAAGTYTLVAAAVSGGTSGTAQVTFTVKEVQPPTCTVLWLPPISMGKVFTGGPDYSIIFQVLCSDVGSCRGNDDDDPWDNRSTLKDKSVKVSIYEIYSNGSTSSPQVFIYSSNGCSSRGNTYSIDCNDDYEVDYDTDRGTHRYHIDVYRFPNGNSNPVLIGTKEFTTK